MSLTNILRMLTKSIYVHIYDEFTIQSCIQIYKGQHKHLWTLVDPNLYMRCVDIFPHYSTHFSSLIISQKDIITPHIINNCMTDFSITTASCMSSPPYILLFTPHSPVICKDYFPLVYMYKSSRYYLVFDIDLGPMYIPSVNHSLSLDTGSTAAIKHFGYYCQ